MTDLDALSRIAEYHNPDLLREAIAEIKQLRERNKALNALVRNYNLDPNILDEVLDLREKLKEAKWLIHHAIVRNDWDDARQDEWRSRGDDFLDLKSKTFTTPDGERNEKTITHIF
jgi:hypothetical protein